MSKQIVIITIAGPSGTCKSAIAQKVQRILQEHGITAEMGQEPDYPPRDMGKVDAILNSQQGRVNVVIMEKQTPRASGREQQ